MMKAMNVFAKSLVIACFAFATTPAQAQTSPYDTYDNQNVDALTNCQKNKNCTNAQKAELNAYTAAGSAQCGGQTCSKAQLDAMANTQAQTYENVNDPNYQSGINAANGTGTVVQPTYSGNSATGGAGTASSSGSKGQMIMLASAGAAVATATVLKKPCMSVTGSAWACPLMALAIGQVASSLGGAKGAGASSSELKDGYSYGAGTGTNVTNPTTLTGGAGNGSGTDGLSGNGNGTSSLLDSQIGSLQAAAASLANDVKKSGVSVSSDGATVTMPNGKKVATSTFSSPSAMSAAGFSDSQISDMQNTMADASKQANAKFKALSSLTNDTGGGGGGSGSSAETGGGGGGYDPTGGYGKAAGGGPRVKSASLAGMSKKLGSDSIGVAGDDIFEMISRRYQARDKADNFLKDK